MRVTLSLNDAVYHPGEDVLFKISIRGALGGERILFRIMMDSIHEVLRKNYYISLPECFIEDAVSGLEEGFYEAQVIWGNTTVSLPFAVLSPDRVNGRLVTVFHNHQALNKYPGGEYHSPWAFIHTWSDEFKPYYQGGAYFLHTSLLSRIPVKTCFNLSPSLLAQWEELLEKGVLLDLGDYLEYVSPEDERAQRVKAALDGYRRLAEQGVVEVFSSFFAHPIAGFIADHYGWIDVLDEEVKMGAETTRRVLGLEPHGFWFPELFFSMKLVPVIAKHGFRYTVLDTLHHFVEAIGDKGTPYEPYRVKAGGAEVVVLFRDTSLSDFISFRLNKAKNLHEADAYARQYILSVLKVMMGREEKIVTVALDGENWMLLPYPSPEAAAAYEKVLTYLRSCEVKSYLKTALAAEVVEEARRELTSVPTTTWLGSIAKWTSEKPDVQRRLWGLAERAYNYMKMYEEVFGRAKEHRYILFCMMQILDSDMYWTEFINEEHVAEWYSELSRVALARLNSLRIKSIRKRNNKVTFEIESPLEGQAVLEIRFSNTLASRRQLNLRRGVVSVEEEARGGVIEAKLLTPKSLCLIGKPIRATCR